MFLAKKTLLPPKQEYHAGSAAADLLNIIQPIAPGKALGLYTQAKSLGEHEKKPVPTNKDIKTNSDFKRLSFRNYKMYSSEKLQITPVRGLLSGP